MKVLNIYAGIGGNRKLWPKECEVTAVEWNYDIAKIYQDFFPNDKVVVKVDAHKYLLEHYKEFDFIWSSPPCQSHSITNHFLNAQGYIRYPEMALWQEIIFLKHFFKGKWVVENVKPYYEPLVIPQYSGRHAFWCNFKITDFKTPINDIGSMHNKRFTIKGQRAGKKKQTERNAVYSPLGLHIFICVFKEKQQILNGL